MFSIKHLLFTSLVLSSVFGYRTNAHAQAQITSPSTSSPLSTPSFTLKWQNVGAKEYFIYLGSGQGLNDYYGGSMGVKTQATFTWTNPPKSCWVRLFSNMPVYSGYANSTVAYYQWQARDYFYKIGVQDSGPDLRLGLIEALEQKYWNDDNYTAKKDPARYGQCKAYLQAAFAALVAKQKLKLPDGNTPEMPRNLGGYYWDQAGNKRSGFTQVSQVLPRDTSKAGSATTQLTAIKSFLKQVKRGDYIQYGTVGNTSIGLHTLAITADYAEGQKIRWADSNWAADEVVHANQSRTLDELAAIIAKDVSINGRLYPKGATLYRIRSDLKK